jgi:hypothetical protein
VDVDEDALDEDDIDAELVVAVLELAFADEIAIEVGRTLLD